MESTQPAFRVGVLVSVEWPDDATKATAQVVSVRKKQPKRKRTHRSSFQYLLQWSDGSASRWTRLLHLCPQVVSAFPSRASAAPAAVHTWECDSGDHAETPALAYAHVAPLLSIIAAEAGIERNEMRLYDPYYCAGSAVRHL